MKIKLLELPKIKDKRGDLTYLEKNVGIPFQLKRVFWTYDLKTHSKRGGHAYKTQNEVICVVSGSADLVVKYRDNSDERIRLNRADQGVYIPAKVWRHLENFATNTVMIHISDADFDEEDYIRDFNQFLDGE